MIEGGEKQVEEGGQGGERLLLAKHLVDSGLNLARDPDRVDSATGKMLMTEPYSIWHQFNPTVQNRGNEVLSPGGLKMYPGPIGIV